MLYLHTYTILLWILWNIILKNSFSLIIEYKMNVDGNLFYIYYTQKIFINYKTLIYYQY